MQDLSTLKKRRSIYGLSKDLPISDDELKNLINSVSELTPDAFNMRSQRLVVALGEVQNELWDGIFDIFGGKITREKIDLFKNAYGTVLFFYDDSVVKDMQERYPNYANNFVLWAREALAMLQINLWNAFASLEIGANLQHYNPVINELVREKFELSNDFKLLAQMPFGGILHTPEAKEKEDISKRVIFFE
ncbi:MAG: nitroreductase family protein [Campylobacter sp.]|nr:nitroreductase family protein [Campylobacter sp.]